MKIKTYKDGTYNIYFEVGDYVKIENNKKFSSPNSTEGTWGKVKKVSGKKVSQVTFVDSDKKEHTEFIWNLVAVDKDGKKIPESQLFKLTPIKESFIVKNFSDWTTIRIYKNI